MTTTLRRAAVLGAVTAVAVGLAAARASAAGGTWNLERPVVAQQPTGDLGGISCVPGAQTRCLAVGSATSHLGDITSTTQLWDGSSWQDEGSPHRTTVDLTYLRGVSCTAALTCMAVGDDSGASETNRTLAAQWTPESGWRLLPTPNPATTTGNLDLLDGVACPSDTDCVAVGSYTQGKAVSALIETWDGSHWAVTDIPALAKARLQGVSCTSASSCVAVGSADGKPLALHWDGSSWTTVATPAPGGTSALHAVSCATAQSCVAVGQRYKNSSGYVDTLAEHWDGTSWTLTDTQDVPGAIENQLFGVSCVAANYCVAVGAVTPYNQEHTLAEVWNGTHWRRTRTPNGGKGTYTQFEGVSCVSGADCLAVGTATVYFDPPGRSFTAHWTGSEWNAVDGGDARGAVSGKFNGLSCPNAENCVAVGSQLTPDVHDRTLAEMRTSSGWRVTPTPQGVGFSDTLLAGVSCTSARACMAVGRTSNVRFGDGPSDNPYAVWWNGTSWTRTDPISARGADRFLDVSCTTPRWCVAVGDAAGTPLLETWDGTTWTKADVDPPDDAFYSSLSGVSCAGPHSCVAVGGYTGGDPEDPHTGAFAVVADGSGWRTEDTGLTGYLSHVSCATATYCMAVGSDQSSGENSTAQRWDGSTWHTVPMPGEDVDAVSCATPTVCAAVGQNYPRAPHELVESWNGTRWTVDPDVASSGLGLPVLYAVSCATRSTCTAAGVRASVQTVPLIEATNSFR